MFAVPVCRLLLALRLVFLVFASVHAAAWTYDFPTIAEAWLWRASAVLTTVSVLFAFAALGVLPGVVDSTKRDVRAAKIIAACVAVYLPSRVFILLECLFSLRAAPAGIYETFDWGSYWPYFQ